MILVFRGNRKVQKEPNGEAIRFVWGDISFFSFQTAIPIEWEIKERVHEEVEIAGMCGKLSYEGKMEHLLGRTKF